MRRVCVFIGAVVGLVAAGIAAPPGAAAHDDGKELGTSPVAGEASAQAVPCENGMAGEYPCDNVDLLAHLPLNTIGGGSGNDIWGWSDPQTGSEYALVGRTSGTSFVDITDAENPVYLGNLPTATSNSSWRDIKVNGNHAYIVSEASGHGLQVFDLTRLRDVANPPVQFSADGRETSFGNAHNLEINSESGFAYVVGSGTCSGGPRMYDLSNPTSPSFVGCVSGDGYSHDTNAVIYQGPDERFQGSEILFSSNENSVTIFDVSDKSNPVQLSRTTYSGSAYTHQGWLTEDHANFLWNDELDEQNFGHNTRTRVLDVSSLTSPTIRGSYDGTTGAIDHNLYVKGNFAYEANYTAGLQIIDLTNVANPSQMTQVAHFDVHPANNNASFNGSWSNYPFYESGVVVVSSIERGLFVLQPNLDVEEPGAPVAAFDFDCDDATLACDFDGSGSAGDNAVDSWDWDFGDGTTGTGETVSHTYDADDTYSVTLTVTDTEGLTGSHTQEVQVGEPPDPPDNAAPVASFTESCTVFFIWLYCSFDGSGSSDTDGTVVSWDWDFGDGSTGSGATSSHFYGSTGPFTVTLTVTDDEGATGSTSHTVP